MRHRLSLMTAVVLLILLSPLSSKAQTSAFTYQGRLSDSGTPATGTYDLQFALFDSLAGGGQVGSTQTVSSVSVSAGIFSVSLDFGASAFPGANRWLEIRARLTTTPSFTTLSPRQAISSSPYAVRAVTATTADNLNTGGTITGNIVNATSQINLNGNRVVGLGPNASLNNFLVGLNTGNALTTGRENTFIGLNAGQFMTGGTQDCANCGPGGVPLFKASHSTFVGYRAGANTTTGGYNTFFGSSAGANNLAGISNSFFGSFAGALSEGGSNSFFGAFAGSRNVNGISNAFFGTSAGLSNVGGSGNSFFGTSAGSLSIGDGNSFFGNGAGSAQTAANGNTFFGFNAGNLNATGSFNTVIGVDANLGSGNLVNATAIGARAFATQSDTLILGGITGINDGTSVNVGIGTTTPQARLDVRGTGVFRPSGAVEEVSFGTPAGETGIVIKGPSNRADIRFNGSTLKLVAGVGTGPPSNANGLTVDTFGNVGIGTAAPSALLHINGETLITTGSNRAVSIGNPNGESGIRIGGTSNRADVRFDSTALRLVAGGGTTPPLATSGISITTFGNVGIGQTSPLAKLDVAGTLKVDSLAGGGDQSICRNSTFNTIATCSSSLRYKKEIAPYRAGLELINRLHPIAFSWKTNGARDLGFGAEDVAKVEPLLVTQNDNDEIEGVRYDRINVVLVNAIKQQQEQISRQQEEIASLKKLVCRKRRRTGVCK